MCCKSCRFSVICWIQPVSPLFLCILEGETGLGENQANKCAEQTCYAHRNITMGVKDMYVGPRHLPFGMAWWLFPVFCVQVGKSVREDRVPVCTTILLKQCLYSLVYLYSVDICPFVQVCHSDCFRLRRSAVHFTALPISCFACACFVFVSGLEGVKAVAMTPALFGPIHFNS